MSERRFIRLGSTPEPTWLVEPSIGGVIELEPKPFDEAEFARRVTRTRERLEDRELDGILVFRPSSVEYLCGHHTIETAPQPLLVTAETVRIYVPDPEVGRALCSGTSPEIAHYAASEDALALIAGDVAALCGDGAIAIEDRDSSVPPRILSLLERSGIRTAPGEYLIETLRLVLSPAEIACMDRAAEATARGAAAAKEGFAEPGITDSRLAARIGEALRAEADSSAAMDVIVATGRRGGVPHSSFRDIPLSDGTTFVEFSGTHHRYHAPLMVTLARQIDERARRLETLAQMMLETVTSEARPGMRAADLARLVQARIELADEDIFHFNYGYAIGLAHPPGWLDGAPFSLIVENESILEAGMAFHLPGSFRSFGYGGVGLSHAIVLEPGGARVLTGAGQAAIHVG